MFRKLWIALFVLSTLLLEAAAQEWKNKQYSEWTEDDAQEVMTNSPWAKKTVATPVKPTAKEARTAKAPAGAASLDESVTLTLRWESARPMREAELKAHFNGAPPLTGDYYAIAVYGIPRGMVESDSSEQRLNELKKLSMLKREGKKDVRPSKVQVLLAEGGPVVMYLFSKSDEFTWRDHGIAFQAQVSRLKFSQAFSTDDMTFHGKLEL
jgi:hypothetical protein